MNQIVKDEGFHEGKDEETGSWIVDEDKVRANSVGSHLLLPAYIHIHMCRPILASPKHDVPESGNSNSQP